MIHREMMNDTEKSCLEFVNRTNKNSLQAMSLKLLTQADPLILNSKVSLNSNW